MTVFHHLGALLSGRGEEWVDLLTPFAVLATALAVLLALQPSPLVWTVAFVASVLYADGHGIHLAANDIRNERTTGSVEDVAHFWDETWGHIEWHAGWFGLLAAFALAAPTPLRSPRRIVIAAAVLSFTMFTNTVEGGDWWLTVGAAVPFCVWAVRTHRPLAVACGGAFAFAAALIGVWALWHGGVPQFSELGWI